MAAGELAEARGVPNAPYMKNAQIGVTARKNTAAKRAATDPRGGGGVFSTVGADSLAGAAAFGAAATAGTEDVADSDEAAAAAGATVASSAPAPPPAASAARRAFAFSRRCAGTSAMSSSDKALAPGIGASYEPDKSTTKTACTPTSPAFPKRQVGSKNSEVAVELARYQNPGQKIGVLTNPAIRKVNRYPNWQRGLELRLHSNIKDLCDGGHRCERLVFYRSIRYTGRAAW
jgi:hypothetical protein